jgi:Tfp pilus assembly PilM family ATPase
MRISQLIKFVEDKAIAAAPRIGHAVKNAAHAVAETAHDAKIEVCARAVVVKTLMVEKALERDAARVENEAQRNARQIVEQMEICNRALEILHKRDGKEPS